MLSHFSRPWELKKALDAFSASSRPQSSAQYTDAHYTLMQGRGTASQSVTGDKLVGSVILWDGVAYSLYETPGPALDGDSSRHEAISFESAVGQPPCDLELSYNASPQGDSDICFDALLNLAYFVRRDILAADRPQAPARYWSNVLDRVSAHLDDDPARQALIVDIASELPRYMEHIVAHPKRALRRVRDLERIQRVREIDQACLIDLARRPGVGVAEKAGSKQRILAVRRHETCATLENRVVLHCCSLVSRAAQRYIDVHSHIKAEHSPRKKAVDHVQRKARAWSTSESLHGVKPLQLPCKSPNYVLLQNPHYSRVWNFYRQLVKNEEVRAKVWRWQRQLWRDVSAIGLADLVGRWVDEMQLPIKICVAEARVASGLKGFRQGRFLSEDTMPGPYILGETEQVSGTLYVVDNEGLCVLYPSEDDLKLMNADYYLVWEAECGRKMIPIYCLMSVDGMSLNDMPAEGVAAAKRLDAINDDIAGVIIVRPSLDGSAVTTVDCEVSSLGIWDISLSIYPGEWESVKLTPRLSPISFLMR